MERQEIGVLISAANKVGEVKQVRYLLKNSMDIVRFMDGRTHSFLVWERDRTYERCRCGLMLAAMDYINMMRVLQRVRPRIGS